MTEEKGRSGIKVTDHRHFAPTGERRQDQSAPEDAAGRTGGAAPTESSAAAESRKGGPAPAAGERAREAAAPRESSPQGQESASASRGLSEIASGLVSSFSLLVARLAQETEIYLGLVPYPGKNAPEPDFEAARAMIDMLSMLEEKTKGNLSPEESRLLTDLIYTYRLEFVRRAPSGSVSP